MYRHSVRERKRMCVYNFVLCLTKGTACSMCCENHRLPAMYTVVVVYGSYTLGYNCPTPWASCIHGYKRENAYSFIVVYLIVRLRCALKPL